MVAGIVRGLLCSIQKGDKGDSVPTQECRRESTEHGPDFCAPCSELLEEWVPWEDHQELVKTILFLRAKVELLEGELKVFIKRFPEWV